MMKTMAAVETIGSRVARETTLPMVMMEMTRLWARGGKGNNVLTGSTDADKFKCGKGANTITDINAAEDDKMGKFKI